MSSLNEKRLRVLAEIQANDVSRENLREKSYNKSNIEYFKEEGLITGSLDSLQLTTQGYTLLAQHNLIEQTGSLNEIITELRGVLSSFSESSSKQNEKVIAQTKSLKRLTWAILGLVIVNAIILIVQVGLVMTGG